MNKKTSSIVAITLVSSLALFAAGCDSNKGTATNADNADNAASTSSMSDTAGTKLDNATADVKQDAKELGSTMERKADQAGQAIDDTAITTSIKSKYLADDTLKGRDISVKTEHGVVTLTGAVENEAASQHAVEIAKAADGVVTVNNSLTIK
jgi:hyperosmotically inducible protein